MDNFKINVDREKLSSDYIQSKQNFQKVMHHVKATKPPVWKSGWFYGTIGLASVAGLIVISTLVSNQPKNDIAEKNNQQQAKAQTILAETTSASIFVPEDLVETKSVKTTEIIEKHTPNLTSPKSKIENTEKPQPKTEDVIPVEQINEEALTGPIVKNKFPKISGHFTGEIPCSVLCNSNGIEVNEDIQITSFTIQFEGKGKDQTINVVGNKIPESICSQISDRHFDQMIFITNIFGVDKQGVNHNFTPMNLIAISQE